MLEIEDAIADPAEFDRMYTPPAAPSVRKVTRGLTAAYRRMIEASPFVAVATCVADGIDCSPRGDSAGFVRVADAHTLLLPERRGNNRIDSLRNLDPKRSSRTENVENQGPSGISAKYLNLGYLKYNSSGI